MTPPADGRRLPGTTLLNIAPLLFSEQFVSTVVHPTIADLQSEFAAAGASRVRRLRALVRGYAAFWTVMILAPFTQSAAPERIADGSSGFVVITIDNRAEITVKQMRFTGGHDIEM